MPGARSHTYGRADEDRQYRVLQEVLYELSQFKLSSTPPEMACRIHQIVRQEMGARNPYQQAKETSTRQALNLYPRLKALVAEADDPRGLDALNGTPVLDIKPA